MENEKEVYIGEDYSEPFEIDRFNGTRVDELIERLNVLKKEGYVDIEIGYLKESNYTKPKVTICGTKRATILESERDTPEGKRLIRYYKKQGHDRMICISRLVDEHSKQDYIILKKKFEGRMSADQIVQRLKVIIADSLFTKRDPNLDSEIWRSIKWYIDSQKEYKSDEELEKECQDFINKNQI